MNKTLGEKIHRLTTSSRCSTIRSKLMDAIAATATGQRRCKGWLALCDGGRWNCVGMGRSKARQTEGAERASAVRAVTGKFDMLSSQGVWGVVWVVLVDAQAYPSGLAFWWRNGSAYHAHKPYLALGADFVV